MLNLGYLQVSAQGVTVTVYYDQTVTPVGDTQPLINGPRGYCLDISNPTGAAVKVTAAGQSAVVGKGDPVTTGQAKSMTAAQLAKNGITTRGQIAAFLGG